MKFREVGGGRVIASPSLDEDELDTGPCSFQGEFDVEQLHVSGGDSARCRGGGSITQWIVTDLDLTSAVLDPFVTSDVRLKSVDLSNTIIQQATLRRTEWLRGRAIGLRLSADKFPKRGSRPEQRRVPTSKHHNSTVHVVC